MKQPEENPIPNQLQATPRYLPKAKINKTTAFAVICILAVIAIDIWFVSFGTWTSWPTSTDYYDQLASAFAHGSLSLEKAVDPALLSLSNPYYPGARGGTNYPLDFSLYKGKYYLYFGPVPALLLVVFKLLGFSHIGDQVLVFIFIAGIFVFQSLLIIKIRGYFFQNVPTWTVPICILCCGLICPFAWMLTEARVYEAAGAGTELFFLAGLYFVITAFFKEPVPWARLALGGIAWALAIGSRLTQAVPIGILAAWATFFLIRTHYRTGQLKKALYRIAALGIPLALGFALLGWYNWSRFDSVFETGFRYELTTSNLYRPGVMIFSPVYILPNSYNYLVTPPQITAAFPFLQVVRGRGEQFFPFIVLPNIYHTRATTGLLFAVPFFLLAAISIFFILPAKKKAEKAPDPVPERSLLSWMIAGLWGAFLTSFAVMVSYFWVVTRFAADFTPSLVLLSVIGFWLGYRALVQRTVMRRIYLTGAIGLMLISVVMSNLLVLSARAPVYNAFMKLFFWH